MAIFAAFSLKAIVSSFVVTINVNSTNGAIIYQTPVYTN